MDFYFGDHWRMDWGFGNPNKTAALIATLMIAVWLPAWRDARSDSRRPWFWTCLALFLGLGICLVHTYSRGGLVAAALGLAAILGFLPRPWTRRIGFPVAATVALLAGYAFLGPSEAGQRYVQGLRTETEDRSITNRLEIWKRAPAMMADAPGGWGLGQSGFAYTQYYQPPETRFTYRTLVNSHLTWLVEFGAAGRIAYLAGWLLLLSLTWPPGLASPLPFAAWLALGVAGFFSSVLEAWPLFVVPGLLLGSAILSARRATTGLAWRCRKAFLVALPGAFLVAGGLWIAGSVADRGTLDLHHAGGITTIEGGEAPETTFHLYRPDLRVVGNHFGISIRKHLQSPSGISERWVVSLEASEGLPVSDALILSGALNPAELPAAAASTDALIFLNPAITDLGILSEIVGHPESQTFILGGRLRDRSTLRLKQAIQSSNHRLVEIGGARTYLPSWIEAATTQTHTTKPSTP